MNVLLLLGAGACLACESRASESGGADDITAVSSRTARDYVRTRLANKSYAPESYTFGEGGAWPGSMKDLSIERLNFQGVARTIAGPLASQNYIPSQNLHNTKLLIMVYWGATIGTESPSDSVAYQNLQAHQAPSTPPITPPPTTQGIRAGAGPQGGGAAEVALKNSQQDDSSSEMATVAAVEMRREQADIRTAELLGFDSALAEATGAQFSAFKLRRDDLIAEIEESRYFVVLMAYDFQALWKEKKHRLLWETRLSIRQRHHALDADLPAMAQYASRFFGQDSHGLVHEAVPLGRVDIGDVKTFGEVPDK
jgi:hypothetical protein